MTAPRLTIEEIADFAAVSRSTRLDSPCRATWLSPVSTISRWQPFSHRR
jgi:hypothetical protein